MYQISQNFGHITWLILISAYLWSLSGLYTLKAKVLENAMFPLFRAISNSISKIRLLLVTYLSCDNDVISLEDGIPKIHKKGNEVNSV